MAEVFLAETERDTGTAAGRRVALKMMAKSVDEESFADEADLMALLDHPNLVRQLEVGTAFGRHFIAMELLEGGDLGTRLKSLRARTSTGDPWGLSPSLALHVAIELLRGLASFHGAKTRSGRPLGLVHGDVTPANCFFSGRGEVKLGDFGVAKSAALGIGPAEGVTAGKLHYLSPEQTRHEKLTPRSDLFSLGIVLCELLTGRHPFLPPPGRAPLSDDAVLTLLRSGRPDLPASLSPELAAVLRRALAADPEQRFQTAGEFAGALIQRALDE